MIPIQLTLQGLYSYKERQTIDFQPLIAAGLFGLFGAVGSGKSAILEAIMLALYNKTERLTKNDRNYNIMNLQSNVLYIDFIFHAGASNKDKFRAIYHTKRNSKNFNDVSLKERIYYKWEHDQWLPLSIDSAASILGNMSYENFMKTVIIPQGKFREFVDQSISERTKMLKELFPLEKFDLYSKTGKLLTQTKADIQTVEKLLEEIGELDTEDIDALEKEILALVESQKENAEKLKRLRKVEERLRALEKLFKDYYEISERLNQLKSEQAFFLQKESQLDVYTKAYTYFKEKLALLATFTEELKKKKAYLDALDSQIKEYTAALEAAGDTLNKAREELGQIETAKQQCEDLKTIIEIGKAAKLVTQRNEEATKASTALKSIQEELLTIKKQEELIQKKIEEQELALQNLDQLREISHWMEKEAELLNEKHEASARREELLRKKRFLINSFEKVIDGTNLQNKESDPGKLVKLLSQEKEKLTVEADLLQKEMQPLHVKEQLASYAAALEEGDPCPLCGAKHHPELSEHDTVVTEIELIEKKLARLKEKEEELAVIIQEAQQFQLKLAGNSELMLEASSFQERIEEKIAVHNSLRPDIPEGCSDLEQVKERVSSKNSAKQQLITSKERLDSLRKSYSQKEATLEEKRNALQNVLHEKVREEERSNQLHKMLKIYEFKRFENHSLEQLNASWERGLKKIASVNENFEKANLQVQKIEQTLNRLKGQQSAEELALSGLLEKTTVLDEEVKVLVKQKGFYSVPEIHEVLKMNLNIDRERQEIDQYKNELLKIEQQFHLLKKEIDNREYKASQHQEVIQEVEDLEEQINAFQSTISLKQKEIQDINYKIKRREEFHHRQEALELRKHNLSELCNLFRGNGFMNYVSSLYLNNLCKAANERFLKLTKNNLSLELNEQNDFIIRDFLNNGRTRLLKTLSGGQTFQAALCLALALAENVKVLNQADQSFFFLDEGFGALDKNSLRVVFDTLKTLRHENRVVGIISHVEELQQEIDVYLEVENDRDLGSQVKYSWK